MTYKRIRRQYGDIRFPRWLHHFQDPSSITCAYSAVDCSFWLLANLCRFISQVVPGVPLVLVVRTQTCGTTPGFSRGIIRVSTRSSQYLHYALWVPQRILGEGRAVGQSIDGMRAPDKMRVSLGSPYPMYPAILSILCSRHASYSGALCVLPTASKFRDITGHLRYPEHR